jgi:hypothetical protein
MERGEERVQVHYGKLVGAVPGIEAWIRDEEQHEAELLGMLEERKPVTVMAFILAEHRGTGIAVQRWVSRICFSFNSLSPPQKGAKLSKPMLRVEADGKAEISSQAAVLPRTKRIRVHW